MLPARQHLEVLRGAGEVHVLVRGRPVPRRWDDQHAFAVQHVLRPAGIIVKAGVAVLDGEALVQEAARGVALRGRAHSFGGNRQQVLLVVRRLADQQVALRVRVAFHRDGRQIQLVVRRRHRANPPALVTAAGGQLVQRQQVHRVRRKRGRLRLRGGGTTDQDVGAQLVQLALHRFVGLRQYRLVAREVHQRLRRHRVDTRLLVDDELPLGVRGLSFAHGLPGLDVIAHGGNPHGHLPLQEAAAVVGAHRDASAVGPRELEWVPCAGHVLEPADARRAFHDMVVGHHFQQRALHARPVLALRGQLVRQCHERAARRAVGVPHGRQHGGERLSARQDG